MAKKPTISVAIATFNEESRIEACLRSVARWADEIVVVDGGSTDRTAAIAASFRAMVIATDNPPIFHVNKQKALDACHGDWILQLDADEVVTPELAEEIRQVVSMTPQQIRERSVDERKRALFRRHQALAHNTAAFQEDSAEICGFFLPRRNYFLGKPLTYAGTYPDGVIRLVRRGKAGFPQKSVHEQITVAGNVDWLYHDLLHFSNPTLKRYLAGADTYTRLLAVRLRQEIGHPTVGSLLVYVFWMPWITFFRLYVRHKGILDGVHGFLFCLFSGLHFPVAYWKFLFWRLPKA